MKITKVAIAGSGIMGSSWAIVYARAGLTVAIFDRNPETRSLVIGKIADALQQSAPLIRRGETVDDVMGRIVVHDNMADAVSGAQYIHECIEEKIDSKRAIFAELNEIADADAILATTTSSFPVSTFASDLSGRARCIVVHPATPPHLLPVTEICPAPFTDPMVTKAVFDLMDHCGQVPVLIKGELPSFVLNRMQAALLVEMFRCLNEGLISPGDIDKIISQGFGLRWAFLGPFEGVDLNSAGGIREYLERFGFIFNNMAKDLGFSNDVVTTQSIALLESYARERLPLDSIKKKVQWRDQAITALRLLKNEYDNAVL
ncbi:3-hydroxyacyl-CoA dehydrogenase [Agrobacterium vitis]|uniref:3-hydroxyacyl-CoA dehydrogenase n=1 Tax=Rhizobium/Agrobacterium group TaxID=227290 RepID=UPI0012E8D210|nr:MULTISPECIES: 3-hydroxyacyl-CoA dehydrogenase [Rhizobium/Agrobacterium group]MCF1464718.1 3-hydroxyacyl-CoA dehydrogenase [Allorhizobium ampelinum]MVA52772.1 3-hydroxyacyl-CoA dehydrogenase [Agrobacterium vitis]